jgi:tetratricopeptide (TPR) repeat protein
MNRHALTPLLLLAASALAGCGRSAADPRALADAAHAAITARDWTAAEAAIDRLDAVDPTRQTDLVRAELERSRGRPDAALAILERIPSGDPQAPVARLFAGQIERARFRARPAEAHWRAALELDPGQIQARRELIALLGTQLRRSELCDEFRHLARLVPLEQTELVVWTASHEDIWANATILDDLRRFLAADPDDRASRVALARVLQRSGQLDESRTVLAPLPDSDPEARVLRARDALDRNQPDEAQALLGPADAPTDDVATLVLRAQIALRRRDADAAITALREAERRDPGDREVLQNLALALTLHGDREQAEAYGQRAGRLRDLSALLDLAKLGPRSDDPGIPRRIGAACAELGYPDEARAWYGLAIRSNPADAEAQAALYRLGPAAGTPDR